jgi:hypothetical protein
MTPASIYCQTIHFGDRIIKLTAQTIHKVICEWHLHSFTNAFFLSAPRKAITVIAEKLGLAENVDADEIINSIDQSMVQAIQPLKVFTSECDVALTDIVINNMTGSQKFGIGLLIDDNNHLGPVTIDGVALLITLTPTPKKTPSQSDHDKNNV